MQSLHNVVRQLWLAWRSMPSVAFAVRPGGPETPVEPSGTVSAPTLAAVGGKGRGPAP